ncbi:MAG: hypothetical protein ACXWD4_13540 [Bacteroidia bacterium]
MKAQKFISLFILLCISLFTFTSSCKKDPAETDKPGVDQPNTIKIFTATPNVKNYQVVVIGVSGKKLDEEKYTATLGDTNVVLAKLNDSTLVFMVPDGIAGTQELKIEFAASVLPLSITAVPAIQNPDVVINQFTNALPAELDKIEAYFDTSAAGQGLDKAAIKRDFDKVRKKYQDQMAAYNALSAEDKLICASFLLSNKEIIEKMQASTLELMTSLGMKKKAGCLSETLRLDAIDCQTEKLMEEVILLGAGSTIGIATGAIIGGPLGIAVAGVMVGLIAEKQYYAIVAAWENLANKKWSLVNVINWGFNKSATEFEKGKPKKLTFNIRIKNIQPSTTGGLAGKMIGLYNKALMLGNYLGLETLPNYKAEQVAAVGPEAMKYISLAVTNNPKVTGTIGGTPDNMQITFSSTEETEQTFQFEIIYNDGEKKIKSTPIEGKIVGHTFTGVSFTNKTREGVVCEGAAYSCDYEVHFNFSGNSTPIGGTVKMLTQWDSDGDGVFEGNADKGLGGIAITEQNSVGNKVVQVMGFCWGSGKTNLKFNYQYVSPKGVASDIFEAGGPK